MSGPPLNRREGVVTILRLFMAASRNVRLYPGGHPVVEASVDTLFAALAPALSHWRKIRFDAANDAVFGERDLLDMDSPFVVEFASDCVARRIGSLTFLYGVTRPELAQVVSLFAKEPEELVVEGGFPEALRTRRVTHVTGGPPPAPAGTADGESMDPALQIYQRAAETYLDLAATAGMDHALDAVGLRSVITSLREILERAPREVFALIASGEHDEESPYHAVNVAVLCLILGARAGLSEPVSRALGLAGYLHDVGRTTRPEDIPLRVSHDAGTFHALAGAYLMRTFTGWDALASVAAMDHHAHLSGGYMRQPPAARAVAIADVYDTVTHARPPLRGEVPHQAMRRLLDGAGTAYDPVLVRAFVTGWGLFPVGTVVRLDAGEVGVVVAQSSSPDRPLVKIVRAEDGGTVEGVVIDLERLPLRHITAELLPAAAGISLGSILAIGVRAVT